MSKFSENGLESASTSAVLEGRFLSHSVTKIEGHLHSEKVPKEKIYNEDKILNFKATLVNEEWRTLHPIVTNEIKKTTDWLER